MVFARAWNVWRTIALLAFYPAVLAHEGIHAAVAWPWAERIEFDVAIGSRPTVDLYYPDDAPLWAVALANVAPFLVGLAAVPAVVWAVRWAGPGTPAALYLAVCWAAVGIPSREDLRPALVLARLAW